MKRFAIGTVIVAILTIIALVPFATAAPQIITGKATNVGTFLDTNGQTYVRIIIQETRSLEGIEYSLEVPAMAFGNAAEAAKLVKVGETIKMIASAREYQGRSSYTIHKILK